MKLYSPEKIKNISIIGHAGSGKTSLAESMLFDAKVITRLGTITEGNTVSDYDPEEIKGRSVSERA